MEAVLATAKVKPAVNQFLYHAGMGPDPDGAQQTISDQQVQGRGTNVRWLADICHLIGCLMPDM